MPTSLASYFQFWSSLLRKKSTIRLSRLTRNHIYVKSTLDLTKTSTDNVLPAPSRHRTVIPFTDCRMFGSVSDHYAQYVTGKETYNQVECIDYFSLQGGHARFPWVVESGFRK